MIYSNKGNDNYKDVIVKGFITGMLICFAVIFFIVFCYKTYKENSYILEDLHTIEDHFIEKVDENYFSEEYLVEEREAFQVELFPYGVTDDLKYQPDMRLMKITWFNKKDHSKVESVEYRVIPYSTRD